MNKDKVVVFVVVMFCFVFVNVFTQLQMDKGYTAKKSNERNPDMVLNLGHRDYDFSIRLLPVVLTVIVLVIIFFSLCDSEDSLVARFDKRLFGDNKKRI